MNLFTLLPILGIIIIILFLVFIVSALYKKAPPNTAMIITGLGGSRTITKGGCFVIPGLQRVDTLSLLNMQSDFTSKDEIPTKDAINIFVDAVANFSVSTDPAVMPRAAAKFLGKTPQQIQEVIRPVLEGNIREIISQMTLKELIQGDKKIIAEKVIENVTPNLRDMGLELTTFNIQNFKDGNGVIRNLGIQNTVQISKDAAISKAQAEMEIAVAQADAEKAANQARVKAQTEIAERENALSIRKSELKITEDTKKAEADAAYQIQKEEQRKTIEISTANANLARQEKELELKSKEVDIREKALDAEVKKTAEAKKYAAQQEADAALYRIQKGSEADLFKRQKEAEAKQFEAEKESEAKRVLAEAVKAEGIAQAEAARVKGEAEAAAIKAKLEAEAEGLLKKAQAMQQYGEAARQDMTLEALKYYFDKLPAIAEAAGKAYTNVDKIYMYGGETSNLTRDIMQNVTQVSEGLGQSIGLDIGSMLRGLTGAAPAREDSAGDTDGPAGTDYKEV